MICFHHVRAEIEATTCHPRAVLDRVHAGFHGRNDAVGPVRVRRHRHTRLVGFVHQGCQFVCGELALMALGAVLRQATAGDHGLDDTGPRREVATYEVADLSFTGDLATQEVAVPAHGGRRRARRHDPRPGRPTVTDLRGQAQRQPTPVTKVTGRGDAAVQELFRTTAHVFVQDLIR